MMLKGRTGAVRWKLVEKFCASLLILVLMSYWAAEGLEE